MNSAERFEAIRARLGKSKPSLSPKPKGLHVAATGDEPSKPKKAGPIPFAATGCKGRIQVCEVSTGYRAGLQWVRQPDPNPVVTLGPKRGYKPHALTKISQQLPMKLTKFPSVETHFIGFR